MAALSAACDQSSTPAPTTPTIAPASVTDTFTGTLIVQSSNSHNFIVVSTGLIAITLKQAGPPSTVSVGVGIGIPSGFSCALTLGPGSFATVQASSTAQITGTAIPGTFCIAVYDPGNLTDPVDYTLTVDHS